MRLYFFTLLILSILIFSCGNNNESNYKPITANLNGIYTIFNNSDTGKLGKRYMPTGFYYLADKENGVKMLKEQSKEVYNITPTPFVSVENIMRVNLVKTKLESGISTSINMVMDKKGTKDLKEGTGNFAYPYIAVVIANKLLYVVENHYKFETGVMSIILVNYSEKEIEEMLAAIKNKK